ncbi:unnamed protein product [Dovyalis caffra]|uniref:Uncharacterized protein n=1 Tax=Dovyalis caffra TaxID=77055 RepID=A0AAV1S616_9ROSI|nr:unnamed protein product [Dovyalis caffra]
MENPKSLTKVSPKMATLSRRSSLIVWKSRYDPALFYTSSVSAKAPSSQME